MAPPVLLILLAAIEAAICATTLLTACYLTYTKIHHDRTFYIIW